MGYPLITAVMVTYNRLPFVKESYECFKKQTYPAKKILILSDGDEKEQDELKSLTKQDKRILVMHLKGKKTLGELRNMSIDYAPSNLSIQWDDDDWYGPTRMMEQWEGLEKGKSAVMLKEQLHYFRDTGEVAWVVDKSGIEGTLLLDRRCKLRYPAKRRGEDTQLKHELIEADLLSLAKGGICYCRTYHGRNTWEKDHHIKRIKKLGKTQDNTEQIKKAAQYYPWKTSWKFLGTF